MDYIVGTSNRYQFRLKQRLAHSTYNLLELQLLNANVKVYVSFVIYILVLTVILEKISMWKFDYALDHRLQPKKPTPDINA